MNWGWASTLDQLWHSPAMPMWATLIAAGFFALVVLIVLLRADKTMANGALAVIALLAIGIAASLTVRGAVPSPTGRALETIAEPHLPASARAAALPALSCLDGLAGESVEAACEHAVFASPDSAAAALSYASAQMSQIAADAGARHQTPDLQLLKRTLERDRFGLVAQVLSVRDRCGSAECGFFRLLSDPSRIKANIDEKLYDTLVARHTLAWNAAQMPGAAAAAVAAAANVPTGKPNTVDYPTSDSIPSVSIMTPEPSATPAPAPSAATPTPARRPAAAAKKPQPSQPSAPQPSRSSAGAPTRIAPPPNAGSIGRASVAPVPFVPPQQ